MRKSKETVLVLQKHVCDFETETSSKKWTVKNGVNGRYVVGVGMSSSYAQMMLVIEFLWKSVLVLKVNDPSATKCHDE